MKPFLNNEAHKKWALTGFLIAVLGFNLSAPLKQELSLLDLASTMPNKQDEIVGVDGKVGKITYLKSGDKETIAIFKADVEGIACETGKCLRQKVLNVPFESNAKVLEAAVRAQFEKPEGDLPPKKDKKDAERDSRTTREKEREDKQKIADEKSERHMGMMEDALDRCSSRRGSNESSCLTSTFVRELRSRAKFILKEDALSVFLDKVRPELAKMTKDFSVGNESYRDFSDMIKKLMGELPAGFNNIRDELAKLNKEMLKEHSEQTKRIRSDALDKIQDMNFDRVSQLQQAQQIERFDPMAAQQLRMQANQIGMQIQMVARDADRQSQVTSRWLNSSLYGSLYTGTRDGLDYAVTNNYVERSYANTAIRDLEQQRLSLYSVNSQLPLAQQVANLNTLGTGNYGQQQQGLGIQPPGVGLQPGIQQPGVGGQVAPIPQALRGSRGEVMPAQPLRRQANPNL